MIETNELALRAQAREMRDSNLNGNSLAPVADAMDSAIDEVVKLPATPPRSELPAVTVNPAPAARDDAAVEAGVQVYVDPHPEQGPPGSAPELPEKVEAAKEAVVPFQEERDRIEAERLEKSMKAADELARRTADSNPPRDASETPQPADKYPSVTPAEQQAADQQATNEAQASSDASPAPATEDKDAAIFRRIKKDLDEAESN